MAFATQSGERKGGVPRAPLSFEDPITFGSFATSNQRTQPDSLQFSSRGRATLHRRFTSESATASQPPSFLKEHHFSNSDAFINEQDKYQNFEQKRKEMAKLRDQQRLYEREIQRLQLQSRQNEEDMLRMAEDLQIGEYAGETALTSMNGLVNRTEPATPPEIREHGISDRVRIHSRVASASIVTPPPLVSRDPAQQLMTPPAEEQPASNGLNRAPGSAPGSRRNSNEKGDIGLGNKSIAATMANGPIGPNGNHLSDSANLMSLGQINTTRFLFDDENERSTSNPKVDANATTSPDVKSYLQMNATDDKFPILVRRDSFPGMLSASSAALDLALSQKPKATEVQSGWPSFARHRPAQHSLPMNTYSFTPTGTSPSKGLGNQAESSSLLRLQRAGQDVSFGQIAENGTISQINPLTARGEVKQGSGTLQIGAPPKLQSSFSTSDLPTVRGNNFLHVSRGPPDQQRRDGPSEFHQLPNGNGAAIFGPPLTTSMPSMPLIGPPGISPLTSPAVFASQSPIGMGPQMFPQTHFANYPIFNHHANMNDSHLNQAFQYRGGHRRNHDGEANRFASVNLESLESEILMLCKDQHGCRYLQKKLEERNPHYVQMIFNETHKHVIDLMTDPFGNYLCQKLLEYTNDEQRTVLVDTAAPSLVKIALNQHGTRALQKMIEYISTPGQVQTVVNALTSKVVELIQDLNGNHVIQKCLNRLSSRDAQFIFDAVGENCVAVGTHRHGCCVLQRCIDHASPAQKQQLISRITQNAIELVQDPFGNYVVQYILDLGEPKLSEPLICQFLGRVCQLSRQKFSSNVIEKCIRVAEPETKRLMIEEMLNPAELEKLLRDSYANYVIQTAIDYAEATTRQQLVESIKPILPAIRMTPYGRRIQTKIQGPNGSGHTSPNGSRNVPDSSPFGNGNSPHQPTHSRSASAFASLPPGPISRSHGVQNQIHYTTPFRSDLVPANTYMG